MIPPAAPDRDDGGATTSLLYSGDALVGEYTSSGAIVSRYVMGPGVDEPLVWYRARGPRRADG